MLEDLARHPGFTMYAIGGIVVAIIWMVYRTKRDEEHTDLAYAALDLQYQILEKLS